MAFIDEPFEKWYRVCGVIDPVPVFNSGTSIVTLRICMKHAGHTGRHESEDSIFTTPMLVETLESLRSCDKIQIPVQVKGWVLD